MPNRRSPDDGQGNVHGKRMCRTRLGRERWVVSFVVGLSILGVSPATGFAAAGMNWLSTGARGTWSSGAWIQPSLRSPFLPLRSHGWCGSRGVNQGGFRGPPEVPAEVVGVQFARGGRRTGALGATKDGGKDADTQDPAVLLSGMVPAAIGDTGFNHQDGPEGVKLPAREESAPVASAASAPASPLWGEWNKEQVKKAVWLWINKLVVGLDLCPFAMESLPGLRIVIAPTQKRPSTLDLITDEMRLLSSSPLDAPAVTIITFPMALFDTEWFSQKVPHEEIAATLEEDDEDWSNLTWTENFKQFMFMATESRDLAQQLSAAQGQSVTSENLLLTFHPNSTFSEDLQDPTDFALRSPFPTLLLLRGVDVRRAEGVYEQQGRTTEDIAIGNEARLASLGFEQLNKLLEGIFHEAKEGSAKKDGLDHEGGDPPFRRDK